LPMQTQTFLFVCRRVWYSAFDVRCWMFGVSG